VKEGTVRRNSRSQSATGAQLKPSDSLKTRIKPENQMNFKNSFEEKLQIKPESPRSLFKKARKKSIKDVAESLNHSRSRSPISNKL
jgi:hypothetical protein